MVTKYETKFPLLTAKINTDPRLAAEFGSLDKFDLVDKEETIEKKIKQLSEQDTQSKIEQAKTDWINALPVALSKDAVLNSFSNIEEAELYFKENYGDYFDCGQGRYQDNAETYCYVNDRFLKVVISAEVFSQKMDVGDRLYWVENVKSVVFATYDAAQYEVEKNAKLDAEIKNQEEKLKQLRSNKTATP